MREGPAQLEPLDSVRERPALAKLGVGAPAGPASLPSEASVRWGPVHQPPVSLSPRPRLLHRSPLPPGRPLEQLRSH